MQAVLILAVFVGMLSRPPPEAAPSTTFNKLELAQANRDDSGPPTPPPLRHCYCTMEYNPVCARTPDGKAKTFPNECHARCAEATVLHRGLCSAGDEK